MTRHSFPAARTVVVFFAVLLSACSDDSTASPPPSSAPDKSATVEVDWATRTVSGVADGPVTVEFCEGEAPYLCFTGDTGHLGVIQLLNYPAGDHDVLAQVIAGGGDESDALEAVAKDFVAGMSADRAEGCGDSYQVVADQPAPAAMAGEEGLRYGFRGVVHDTTVEHVLVHALVDNGTLWVLSAAGYDDGGCLPREAEFDVAGLRSAVSLISDLAAGSKLPAPDRMTTNQG